MSAACPTCSGSGETGAYCVLDCSAPNCTAAVERLALEVAAADASLTDYDARWLAYQAGKALAGFRPWQKLWDTQWMNIVNHDHAYSGWSVEDAVHHAVKMTEERCRLNNIESYTEK